MAVVDFKKGLVANLPATYSEGTFYVTTDERGIYLDISDTARIRIGDFQEFATVAALEANTNPSTTALYYVAEINCLCKFDGTNYVRINLDTGATTFTVTGDGNAITTMSYNAGTRTVTATKETTFAVPQDITDAITALDLDNTYDPLGAADDALDDAKDYADTKVGSVSAGDDSIDIGGTETAPQVSVAIDDTAGNILRLVSGKGLRVDTQTTYSMLRETDSAIIGDNAAVYRLTATTDGVTTKIGDAINIAKDLVVQSGSVVENPEGQAPGTYIELILANDPTHPIYINVGDLIEYVTSGSQAGDMVMINIDSNHQVTASITDGTVTKAKLVTAVQNVIDNAYTGGEHSNNSVLSGITTEKVAAWDSAAGDVIGDPTDTKTDLTIYGVRAYADDAASTAESNAVSTVQGNSSTDTASSATIAGAKKYTDAAKAEVIGESTDVASDDTINGAKAYADGAVTTATGTLIGASTDQTSANTINGAKNFATAAANSAQSTAISTVVGESTDTASADTVNGAKAYADSVVASALTWGTF